MSDGPDRVELYDTTLRDGAQREGISWSLDDKRRIVRRLDALGIDIIEAGWPGSNPKDAEFFARAGDLGLQHAVLAAFGATRRAGIKAAEDPSVVALVESGTPVCTIFGKTSVLHVTEVLRTTLDENLAMIADTVAYLRGAGRRVIYDAEHFFDGDLLDPAYALATLRAAADAGAESIVLCDTNGGSLPWHIEARVAAIRAALPGVRLGIHAHDDAGCATANSLAAVKAGARHVQGTINGYGERCGNANLCTIVPGLVLKLGVECAAAAHLPELPEVARVVAELANLAPDDHAPYIGRSAFAHKGGVHVAAIRRCATSYEHVDPARVGNATRVVVSELSGRANLLARADELGLELASSSSSADVLAQVKAREAGGASFEAADASVALMLRRHQPGYTAPFTVVEYRVLSHGGPADRAGAEATVKLRIGDRTVHTAAEGDGPVHALDAALRKALVPTFPVVARIALADYKVRILDGHAGTSAVTRVLIDFTDGDRGWSTVGASASILEATWTALTDGIEHGIATSHAETLLSAEAHA
ncbi:MAG: citramalate synthase [Deltaproteobacteria bacterium]|nr:citramalate synthase [Deltaproteobacteria bacterium]